MTTRLLRKKALQATLRDLRRAGYDVRKDESGMYRATDSAGGVVLEAMPGRAAYLCRLDEGTFTPDDTYAGDWAGRPQR